MLVSSQSYSSWVGTVWDLWLLKAQQFWNSSSYQGLTFLSSGSTVSLSSPSWFLRWLVSRPVHLPYHSQCESSASVGGCSRLLFSAAAVSAALSCQSRGSVSFRWLVVLHRSQVSLFACQVSGHLCQCCISTGVCWALAAAPLPLPLSASFSCTFSTQPTLLKTDKKNDHLNLFLWFNVATSGETAQEGCCNWLREPNSLLMQSEK